MQSTSPYRPRAVLYLRLSRKTDASTSIVRQNGELLALAEAEGWDVVLVLTDDGRSGGKQRENAQRALEMLARGEVDILAVYAVDRWSRMGIGESGPIIAAVNAHGGRFVAARESIDSKTDPNYWKLRLAFALDTAEKERDNTVARVNSSQRYLREQGYWEGGRVPFGYAAVPHPENPSKRTLVVREREAAVCRELAQRLAAGELPSHLAIELDARGVPTATSGHRRAETLRIAGKPLPEGLDADDLGHWHTQSVQSIMTSDTLLGRRTEWVMRKPGDPEGTPSKTLSVMKGPDGLPRQWWPAILTPAELEAVRANVNNPEDRKKVRPRVPQRQKATRLLSGLAVCANCGKNLYAVTQRDSRTTTRKQSTVVYRCAANTTKCKSKATISADLLEDYVVAHHLADFGEMPEYRATTRSDAQAVHEAALADIMTAIREASALIAEDATPERFESLRHLQEQRDTLQAASPAIETVYTPTGQTHAEAWAEASADGDVAYQRDLLRWHYRGVRVAKGRAPVAERVSFDERHIVETFDARDAGGNSRRGPSADPSKRRAPRSVRG